MNKDGHGSKSSQKAHWGLVRSVIALPGTVLFMVPAVILLLTQNSNHAPKLASPAEVYFWLAIFVGCLGAALSAWSVALLMRFGDGTPAPWEPTKKIVVRGPYRYVRNPMITGALLILSAQAMLFQSLPIAIWMIVFLVFNLIYFPKVEEPRMLKRFGDKYLKYQTHVPRWIPRLHGWNPENE